MKLLKILIWTLDIVFLAIPFIYWMHHPELTYMEMLLKFWWAYSLSLFAVFAIIGLDFTSKYILRLGMWYIAKGEYEGGVPPLTSDRNKVRIFNSWREALKFQEETKSDEITIEKYIKP